MATLTSEVLDFRRDVLPLRGKLRFPLTHDYMFAAVFRRNTCALKGFLAAKLKLSPEDIVSLEIMNPMEAGSSADDKDVVLDVKVCLNNQTIIDIEMQVAHYDYLPERFLHQICRIYSGSLLKGKGYGELAPVIHIAIMDRDLFPRGDPRNTKDFLSEFYLENRKTHQIFTGKFHMEVVSLKYLDNAEDKEDPNGIYRWARLLKSNTWEELNMIAENNEYMEAAALSVCAFCNDPKFVAECERRLRNEWEYNSRMAEADRKGMERGMKCGMKQGLKRGLEQGLERGLEQGLERGLEQGLERGLEQGLERGLEQGLERGIEQGLERGIEQGLERGLEQGIRVLVVENLEEGKSAETIINKLIRHFSLDRDAAEGYYKRFGDSAELLFSD